MHLIKVIFVKLFHFILSLNKLFQNSLQWCDNSALSVVEGILADPAVSSGCLFFVGSYRSNEVQEDHQIFKLMDSLRSSSVPTTTISLEGLLPQDLNTMISDALCMFPRVCEPFSDMVFQKTKGSKCMCMKCNQNNVFCLYSNFCPTLFLS